MATAFSEKKLNLTKVPLAFAEGATLKKGARWNNEQILDAGTYITAQIIEEYADVALHIPASLRIETTTAALEKQVEKNIRKFKEKQMLFPHRRLGACSDPGQHHRHYR